MMQELTLWQDQAVLAETVWFFRDFIHSSDHLNVFGVASLHLRVPLKSFLFTVIDPFTADSSVSPLRINAAFITGGSWEALNSYDQFNFFSACSWSKYKKRNLYPRIVQKDER